MKHIGEHLTGQEARELVHDLHEYADMLLEEIHEEVKAELEAEEATGEADETREAGLHHLFENLKHAKELYVCLMAEMSAMPKEIGG